MTEKKYISEDLHLMQEWDYEANGDLDPSKITVDSGKKVWWKCRNCGYEWQAVVASRSRGNHGCPECAKIQQGIKRVNSLIEKQGSLAEKIPELAKEWHPTKNGDLKPTDVTTGSHKKVWWKCRKCGHEWQAVVKDRALGYHGCPECAQKKNKKQLEFDF